MVWPLKGTGHCILPSPTYTFVAKKPGELRPAAVRHKVGQTKGLFCSSGAAAWYYGTYRCTRVTTVDFSALAKVNEKVDPSHLALKILHFLTLE